MKISQSSNLVVDLDGTLIRNDTFFDSIVWSLFNRPALLFKSVFSLLKSGKAAMKQTLASEYPLDPELLPYNPEVLNEITQARNNGKKIVLATGADSVIAWKVASYLGTFDEVHASDGNLNNTGHRKANKLSDTYSNFDYIGNSSADLESWKAASRKIIVSSAPKKIKLVHKEFKILEVRRDRVLRTVIRQLRIHQWAKNALLFVPILLSHRLSEAESWLKLFFGFMSFGLVASGVYILNDLADIENDRKNRDKKNRPLAAGDFSAIQAIIAFSLLLASGLIIGLNVGLSFLLVVLIYFGLTTAYSLRLKRILVLDVLVLATLYTLRILAGAAAINEEVSFWILSFSIFIFTSLAFVKRFSELKSSADEHSTLSPGRGYMVSDVPVVLIAGISSAFASLIFLALYIDSDSVGLQYTFSGALWFSVPVFLGWVLTLWFRANRGEVHHDPIIFALRDKMSQMSFIALLIIFVLASVG